MEILIQLVVELVWEVPIVRAFVFTIIPSIGLLSYVRRKDSLEPEPPKLIRALFFLGCAAVVPAGLLEAGADALMNAIADRNSAVGDALWGIVEWFLVTGLVEEGCKYGMLRLRTWKDPEFNCLYDGMVYAVAVSAGFALAENVLYLIRTGGSASAMLLRAVLSVPAHICFSVMMGTWYSAAKRHEHGGNKRQMHNSHAMAVLIPTLAHGGYDWLAVNTKGSDFVWIPFIAFVIGMYVLCFRQIHKLSEEDKYYQEEKNKREYRGLGYSKVRNISMGETWTCVCGTVNTFKLNYCPVCRRNREQSEKEKTRKE